MCIRDSYAAIATASPTAIPTEGGGTYHDNFGTHASGHNGWFRFVHQLIRLRASHPSLRQERYGDFDPNSPADVTMLFTGPDGSPTLNHAHALTWTIHGRAGGDADFALLVNMGLYGVDFRLPSNGDAWERIIDTADWAEPFDNEWLSKSEPARFPAGTNYWIHPHSVAVLSLIHI